MYLLGQVRSELKPIKYILVREKSAIFAGRRHMGAIGGFFSWLFGSRQGVITLVVGGIVLFLIISFILERRTRAIYKNHEKSEDDWDLFGDDESGWSDFDNDNN